MVASVAEGEDKPLKYPLMFRACELVIVNKIDLLPHLDFDLDRSSTNLDAVHPGVDAHARERAHGRGRRRVRDWLAALPARRGRRRRDAGRAPPLATASSALLAARRRPNERFFAAEAERLARLCHGMAERFARGGRLLAFGALAGGALRRAPRRGRVRAPGDRRQAGAARARPRRRGRPLARRSRCWPSPTTSRSPSAPATAGERRGAGARGARLPDRRVRAVGARVGVRAARRDDPFVAPGAGRDALPRALGARARVLRAPRAARGPRRAAACTTPARRASSIRSSASSEHDLDAVLADVRRVVLTKADGGRRAARRRRSARTATALRAAAARRCAPASTPAAGCSRSATAARRPTRWTPSPTSAAPPPARLAGAPRARPHRGPGDPHRDRQRHRHRGDLRAPGHRLRPRRATRCWRSPRAATRRTCSPRWPRRAGAGCATIAHRRLRRRPGRRRGARRPRRRHALGAHPAHPGGAGERVPRAARAGGAA